ncbi:ATP-binding protein [Saccharothrix coeruleofusca]|uniref:ATPase n=1 Tax=Saccharothrix coeruleofusca TaxID=33919 RepID=A0A918EFV5_9PSEU|nr:ATP-binding protein [Saccharothrix coeruleofusca]MBP2335890.1 anti-sigma regulatory factor (Ser/Thr protein kinase) [Saccharothrix coeruleofusca]GGP76826.1 ATPase [Saccharothrix coeruleofusca]
MSVVTTEESEGSPGPLAFELGEGVPPLVQVRRWAGAALADLTDDELGDCLLVVTELVANAYDHGSGPRRVRLERSPAPCSVRVEVEDTGGGEVVLGQPGATSHRGRGLVIVDNLSRAWGVRRHARGKTVWAEIPCEPAAGDGQ